MPSSLCAAALLVAALGAQAVPAAELPPRLARDYDEAIATILCDCGCHPQSAKECACGRAAEMRREIAAQVAGGGPNGAPLSGAEVIARYVEQYGEGIRIAPTARGFNLVAWLGPLVGLFVASCALLVVVRRMAARKAPARAPAEAAAPGPAEEAYRERLRTALERLE